MAKIKIPQLASYAAGDGFGSDVITPEFPSLSNLTKAALYGTSLSVLDTITNVDIFSSLTGLATGLSLTSNGLKWTTGNIATTTIGNVKESLAGSTFFFITPSNDAAAVTVASYNPIVGLDARFALACRWINASGGSTKPFIRIHTASVSQLTTTSNAAIAITKPNSSTYALIPDEPILIVCTKDITNLQVISHVIQGSVYSKATQSTPTLASGERSSALKFGGSVATQPGPVTLHAAGYYDNYKLTDSEIINLYTSLLNTYKSI